MLIQGSAFTWPLSVKKSHMSTRENLPNETGTGTPPAAPAEPADPVQETPEPVTAEKAEEWGRWVTEILTEHPQLLALRERILPWTGGYSFANVVHANTTTSATHLNRFYTLELIYQHLISIGMYETAEMLKYETSHQFQLVEQPWDKTDLHLLVSMGILAKEDPWAEANEPDHQYLNELHEEDASACPHCEDPKEIYKELIDENQGVILGDDGEWKATTLRHFVAFLVTTPTLDDDQTGKWLLILSSFTSSYHFFAHLKQIMKLHKLELPDEETKKKLDERMKNVDYQKNTINILMKWVKIHGLFIGTRTVKAIKKFLGKIVDDPAYAGIRPWTETLLTQLPQLRYGPRAGEVTVIEDPLIPNPRIIFKPSLTIIEPEPLEMARQICLAFHKAFRAVHTREFEVALENQKVLPQTPTLTEFFSCGRRLKNLVLETIATAANRDTATERVLLIVKHLLEMGNYDAVAWILKALRRPELQKVAFLTKEDTTRTIADLCLAAGVDPKNSQEYTKRVESRYSSWLEGIPNMKTEVVLLPKDNSPSFIDGYINWEKRRPLADKTFILYRFQNKSYAFYPVSQIQKVLERGPTMTEAQLMRYFASP